MPCRFLGFVVSSLIKTYPFRSFCDSFGVFLMARAYAVSISPCTNTLDLLAKSAFPWFSPGSIPSSRVQLEEALLVDIELLPQV